jgi:hypothetical protein
MLRFFATLRLAMNPNLYFEIASISFLYSGANGRLDLHPVFRYGPFFAVAETGNQNHYQMKTYEFS